MRVCELYFTPDRQRFARTFPRYTGIYNRLNDGYKRVIDSLVVAAKNARKKIPRNLDKLLNFVYVNTVFCAERNESDNELRKMFADTFHALYEDGKINAYAFYKLVTSSSTTAQPRAPIATFKKV